MYKHIAVGGTFDSLHAGHKHFLSKIFEVAARVTIGLTSTKYTTRFKKKKGISSYSARYGDLTKWLRQEGYSVRVMIVPLHDPLGPAVLPDEFDALAVTSENAQMAELINLRRKEMGFSPLAVFTVDLLKGEDDRPISSSRVRKGVITREGVLVLPDSLRPELQKPMGTVLTPQKIAYSVMHNRDNVIITVGDVTTQKVFSFGVQPSLAIIDLLVERKPYQTVAEYAFPKKYHMVYLKSGPGFIANKAVRAIQAWKRNTKRRTVIVVDGEEDLLVIPSLIHAPVGSVLYYGQPGEGLVEVQVSAAKKKEAIELLQRFV